MSKDEKHLNIKSATEIKQAPLENNEDIYKIKGKKSKETPTKSKHKHDYKITKIKTSWLSSTRNGEPFSNLNHNNEFFIINYKCSICGKDKHDWLRIFIDDWNKNYKDIYDKLKSEEDKNNG